MRQRCVLGQLWATWVASALLLGATVTVAAEVPGSERASAQSLLDEARQLMAQDKYAEACPKFEESVRMASLSGTMISLADCYEKQGRLATAWSMFISAATAARRGGNDEREVEARTRAAALEEKLPKILIDVGGSRELLGLEVKRDDALVDPGQLSAAIPADPGEHRITVSALAHRPWETTVEAKPGEVVTVTVPSLEAEVAAAENGIEVSPEVQAPISIAPPPSAGLGARKTMALVTGGVGLLGVAAGSVFGLTSKSKHDKADEHCVGGACRDAEGVTLRDEARSMGNISTVAFIVGAAGLAGGAALWLTAPKTQTAALGLKQIAIGPTGITLRGAW
jgi:hypothetical protein